MKKTKTNKNKLLTIYAVGISIMLIIAYFAAPYAIVRVGCDAGTSLLQCIPQEPKILFLLFMMPALLLFIALMTAFIGEKEPEVAALTSNMPKIIKMNIGMTIFFIIGSLLMFTVSYLPREMIIENIQSFEGGWYVLTSLVMLYAANMAGKMNKSLFSGWPTPWNMKSDLAWEKSQRFMGFALSLVCVIGIVIAFPWTHLFPFVFIGGLILSYVGCFIVSYYVYKTELALKGESNKADG